MASPKSRIL